MEGGGEPAPAAADWRAVLAGEDAEAMTSLSRFKSSKDFLNTFTEAQKTIRSGAHKDKPVLSDKPTDEELATYRQENGIPAEAKGYLENLPDGLVLGEQDEAMVNSFLESAHGKNMDPASVHSMLDWYANTLAPQQVEAQHEADTAFRAEAVEALREEWGVDFKPNLNSALNFLKSTAENPELILGARLADGTLAGDNPSFMKWLAGVAHEANPSGFVAPGSGLDQSQSVENEIKEIEGLMRTDRTAYNRDEAKQARLRTLYDARAKLQG